jgi:taurine dioxygenase
MYQHVTVAPLAGALGAEIFGVDVAQLNDAEFAEIHDVFRDFGVIFFRDQTLTPKSHLEFAARWGGVNVNRFFANVEGYPSIAEVRKEPGDNVNIGGDWHTDHSYDSEPALGSLLYALEVPAFGGDTMFSSMAAVYAGLSKGMQQLLVGLRAVHSSRHVFGAVRYEEDGYEFDGRLGNQHLATQDATHPIVIKHPLSGRPCLYVNPGFTVKIDGWTEEESRPLLEYLYEQGKRPEHTCRFRWQPGSVALWDNRATWHYALNDYPGERRLMHRVTIEGAPLQAA